MQLFASVRAAFLALFLITVTPITLAQTNLETTSYEDLFGLLKASTDAGTANRIAGEIWRHWMSPDDQILADRMKEIVSARLSSGAERTLELLDKLIVDHPEYAEAWNRRATLHYELGNYEQSLADIEETLVREPRHFGALSGAGLVHIALGDKEKARRAVEAALEVHPFIAIPAPLLDVIKPRLRT